LAILGKFLTNKAPIKGSFFYIFLEDNDMNIPDKLLFGQFLMERRKVTQNVLDQAIEIQQQEKIADHYRMLGNILLHDFNVFNDRIDLKNHLKEFEAYKEEIREMYITAKKYGTPAEDKLAEEFVDLMEELETAETFKIRALIKEIERFKFAVQEVKRKDRKIEELTKEVENLKMQNQNLKNNLKKAQDNNVRVAQKWIKQKGG
jgi:predicted RNase H-like nuclease (RuvC/YqgF family)